jgi:hypothetical protein
MKNDTAGDGPHGGWDQQTQSLDYAYDWHTMSARESHKEARHEYDNTTNLTPEALASMPPPSRSDKVDKVADDNSNDGSEPIYTPPGSIECKSPPFGKRRPESTTRNRQRSRRLVQLRPSINFTSSLFAPTMSHYTQLPLRRS